MCLRPGFLDKDGMSVIADAPWDVLDRFAVIEDDGKSLSGLHRFQLELRLDKIVGTNNPAQIQFCIGPHIVLVLFALFHVMLMDRCCSATVSQGAIDSKICR